MILKQRKEGIVLKRFILLIIMCLFLVSGCITKSTQITKPKKEHQNYNGNGSMEVKKKTIISDYYPFIKNRYLEYKGIGNEFAGMKIYVDFISENKVQIKEINGGTDVEEVIENKDGELRKLFSKAEFYYRLNVLREQNIKPEILLKEPLVKGTAWKLPDGSTRSISGINIKIKTDLGNFNCLEVTTKSSKGDTLQYYSKNIGLVKTIYASPSGSVVSELKNIITNKKQGDKLKLYYPDFNNNKNLFIEKSINLNTNEEIKGYFERYLKISPGKEITPVIGMKTRINELTFNVQKNLVHVDFTKELVAEMNAGAELESMILTCITNTFASYFNVDKVYITIEENPYSSGHILMKLNEPFYVNYKNAEPYK